MNLKHLAMAVIAVTLAICPAFANDSGNNKDNGNHYGQHKHDKGGDDNGDGGSSGSSSSSSTGTGIGIGFGGNSTSDSSSSVKNSGNSSNTNVNVAEGGNGGSAKQAQQQGQNQTATAVNGGQQNSQSTSYSSTYEQVHQAPTVIAPDAYPSAPCRISASVGGSGPLGGMSFGSSRLDDQCDKRETARSFALIGDKEAARQILCSTKAAKNVTSCKK